MSELAKALAAFQAEMPTVGKAHTATIPGQNGRSGYSYTYADLADVMDAAIPLLTKHGLSFSCCPRRSEQGDYDLVGVLLHTSGERLEGTLPIHGSRAQDIGSSLTYGRRYLLGCMTGLVTDDDDDGAAAHQSGGRVERTASEKQLAEVGRLMKKAGMDRDGALKYVLDVTGREVTDSHQMTVNEASRVIQALRSDTDS